MPPIGPEAPHPIPAGMKVNKKNKYDEDVIDNNEEKVIRGKAKDITRLVPYFGTSILPAIWFDNTKKIPKINIETLKSDSSIDNLFIFHGVMPK